jgi:hypothetical protein
MNSSKLLFIHYWRDIKLIDPEDEDEDGVKGMGVIQVLESRLNLVGKRKPGRHAMVRDEDQEEDLRNLTMASRDVYSVVEEIFYSGVEGNIS